MANKSAKFQVTVDVDVATGKINTKKVLDTVQKQVNKELGKVTASANLKQATKQTTSLASATKRLLNIKKELASVQKLVDQSKGFSDEKKITVLKRQESALLSNLQKMIKLREELKKGSAQYAVMSREIQKTTDKFNKVGASIKSQKALLDTATKMTKVIKELAAAQNLVDKARNSGGSKFSSALKKQQGVVERSLQTLTALRKETTFGSKAYKSLTASIKAAGATLEAVEKKMLSTVKTTNKVATASDKLAKIQKDLATAQVVVDESKGLSSNKRLTVLRQQESAILSNLGKLVKLRAEVDKGSQAYKAFSKEIQKTRKSLKDVERQANGPTKAIAEFTNSLRLFIRFAVAFKLLRAIGDSFNFLTGSVIDLQDALTSIKAVANATVADMVSIENAIKNVATTTKFTTQEIAQAAQTLAQAGVGPEDITKTLSAVANFASATNATLQVGADLISTMKNVFNELDVEEIADKLTNAVNISKLTPTGLQTILSRLAQTVKSFKINADEMFAAITVLKNVGIKDSTVSTGLRQGLLELLSPDAKTLKVLEKRYTAIGEQMSQAAIKTLFTGFQEQDNPILAVLNELEKLGIQGSGSKDFQRVFDVRAENVIKALLANKEQLAENQIQLERTGSAAKGATTQLESLKNATSNLGAIISVVASDLSGPLVDGLNDIVNSATTATKALREMFLEQKKATGDSGIGSGIQLGTVVGGLVASRSGLAKGALAGVAAGAAGTAVNANAGEGQNITKGLTDILSVITVMELFKSLFPKALTGGKISVVTKTLGKLKGLKIGTLLASILPALGFIAKGLFTFFRSLSPLGLAVTALVTGYSLFFGESDLEGLQKSLDSRRQVLAKELDDAKNEVAQARTALDKKKKARDSNAKLNDAAKSLQDEIQGLSAGIPEAQQLLEDAAKRSKDVNSDAFKDFITKLAVATKVGEEALNGNDLASTVQEMQNITAKAEGKRKEFLKQFNAASQDPTAVGNQQIIDQFNSLSESQRKFFFTVISDFEQATSFLDSVSSKNTTLEGLEKGILEGIEGVTQKEQEVLSNLFTAVELAIGTDQEQARASELKSRLITAAQNGEEKLIDQISLFIEAFFGREFLTNVDALAQSSVKAEFEKRINKSISESLSANEGTKSANQKSIDSLNQQDQNDGDANRKERQRQFKESNDKLALLTSIQLDLREQSLNIFKQTNEVTQDSLALEEQALGLQVEIDATKQKTLRFRKEEQKVLEKIADIDKGFLIEEAALKEVNRQIAQSKKAQLQDNEKTGALLQEAFKIETDFLSRRKKFISQSLKDVLKSEGLGEGIESKSLGEILSSLDNAAGRDLIKGNAVLSGLIKEAISTRDKLNSAESRLAAELDNIFRKTLDADLKTAESKLSKARQDTVRLENSLSKSTQRLQKATDDLATALDSAAEDALFFEDLRSELSGDNKPESGDAKKALKVASEANSSKSQIEGAKEAARLAVDLQKQGIISEFSAKGTIDKADQLAQGANAAIEAVKRADVAQQLAAVQANKAAIDESKAVEKETKIAVDRVKESIDALPAKIAAALRQASKTKSTSKVTRGDKATVQAAKTTTKASQSTASAAGDLSSAANSLSSAARSLSTPSTTSGQGATSSATGNTIDTGGRSVPIVSAKNIGNTLEADNTRTGNVQQALNDGSISRDQAESFFSAINFSVADLAGIQGKADGGQISGPGTGTSDSAGIFALSNREFVQPAKATDFYGADFMEKIRKLQIPKEAIRAISTTASSSGVSGAETVGKAIMQGTSGQPVTFNFEGAKINGTADSTSVQSFRSQLRLQALKSGRRVS